VDFHAEQTTPQASHVESFSSVVFTTTARRDAAAAAAAAFGRGGGRRRGDGFGDFSNGFDFSTEIEKSSHASASFSVGFGRRGDFAAGGSWLRRASRGGGIVGIVGAGVVGLAVDATAAARGNVVVGEAAAGATFVRRGWRKVQMFGRNRYGGFAFLFGASS